MSYCTESDLVREFGEVEITQLTSRAEFDTLDRMITFASGLIDGYLRERYTVPLVNPPENIVGFACDIVRYRLYDDQPTQTVIDRYEAALMYLKDVSRGLVTLPIEDEPFETRVQYSTPSQVFTRLVW
jgi:phage gp36-like protein